MGVYTVEVEVALSRPPKADATIYFEIEAEDGFAAELLANTWAYDHPRVSMPVRSVVTNWPTNES